MEMKQKIHILVTGVGGGGVGQQIIKALRLSNMKYIIVGTDITPVSIGLSEVNHPYIVPKASDKNYLNVLISIIKKHKIKIIFPGSEPELEKISKNRKLFYDLGIFLPINPDRVIEICMNKLHTIKFLSDNGYYYPKTVLISSIKEIKTVNYFPAIVKPNTGGSGSKNVFIVQNSDELKHLSKYLLTFNTSFIIQEYIGDLYNEFTVGILVSMEGKIINSIAVNRIIHSGLSNKILLENKSNNKKVGKKLAVSTGITQGTVGKFPDVTRKCEDIALSLGCRSTVNIQCRLVDGEVYIFEINPRFSGTTSFRAMVGYNEPDIFIKKYICNQNIKTDFDFRSGIIMREFNEKIIDNRLIEN